MPDKPRIIQRHRTFWFWMRLAGFLLVAAAAAYSTSQTYSTVSRVEDLSRANVALTAANARLVHELRQGLIEGCETNGNPLRAAEREDLREGIAAPNDPRLRELFPNVSPETIRRITAESNKRKRDRLAEVRAVDCVAQYSGRRVGQKP